MYDGVFVYYNWNEPKYHFPTLAEVKDWPVLEAEGCIANGVAIINGDKFLVVATDEKQLKCATEYYIFDGSAISDYLTAIQDWEGKARTESFLRYAASSATTAGPGYCYSYEKMNNTGGGIPKGQWWLPSLGELFFMYCNKKKINYALSHISGATLLQDTSYWSSTPSGDISEWFWGMGNGESHRDSARYLYDFSCRPVSTIYYQR